MKTEKTNHCRVTLEEVFAEAKIDGNIFEDFTKVKHEKKDCENSVNEHKIRLD